VLRRNSVSIGQTLKKEQDQKEQDHEMVPMGLTSNQDQHQDEVLAKHQLSPMPPTATLRRPRLSTENAWGNCTGTVLRRNSVSMGLTRDQGQDVGLRSGQDQDEVLAKHQLSPTPPIATLRRSGQSTEHAWRNCTGTVLRRNSVSMGLTRDQGQDVGLISGQGQDEVLAKHQLSPTPPIATLRRPRQSTEHAWGNCTGTALRRNSVSMGQDQDQDMV